MFRLKIAIIVVGAIFAWNGFQEWSVSRGTSETPDAVELAALEGNPDISNNHLKIGSHIAAYTACVYEYETDSKDEEPTVETKVNHTYYPIISNEHPYVRGIDALEAKYGDIDSIPDAEWPELEGFSVLVKTRSFKTIGAIPDSWDTLEGLQGLVINRIYSLSDEEKDLLQDSFPSMDLDTVLILEEGRAPSSNAKSAGTMAGGGVLILVGIGLLFVRKKQAPPAE